jgi:DNA-binding transcriptional ArsR family regulator
MEKESLLFKTLSHPARLAVLDALRGGEQCVCHLEHALGMRQAYLSQQLAVLKEAGLVRDRRDGWNIFYFVSRPEILAVIDAARKALAPRVKGARGRKNRSTPCPCPKCRSAEERRRAASARGPSPGGRAGTGRRKT